MGGNVFENIQPIRKEDIEPTLQQFKTKLNCIFPKIIFDFKLLGSTGKKDISNDIDLALSEDTFFTENKLKWQDWEVDKHQLCFVYTQIRKRVRTATVKQSKLRALIKIISYKLLENGIMSDPKNSGSGSLFCCFPQYNKNEQLDKNVQIDINIGNLDWLLFSYYSEIYASNIKGLHRTQLIVSLFAYKNRIFRHGSGIFNPETKEYEAITSYDAIILLSKLYKLTFNEILLKNFNYLYDFICEHIQKEELNKIWDIYLKILDSTKTDIPDIFQNYWKQNQERLNLTGKFLPENSQLHEWLNRRR